MTNNNISKYNELNTKNIDYHGLTSSLLKEAIRAGSITEKQIGKFQQQLMDMLSTSILKYTQNDSSSVKTEVAESIMLSLLYCIDIYLLKIPSLDEALDILKSGNLVEIYEEGVNIACEYVEEAKLLLAEVKNSRINLPLIAYNDTVDVSFQEFFSSYQIEFSAHNTMGSIDYPLLIDDWDWTGIIYMKNYLEHLKIENEFCSHFPIDEITKLLESYGERSSLNWEDMLFNITELILKNAICSVLIGKNTGTTTLLISQMNCDNLESNLKNYNDDEIKDLLSITLASVFTEYNICEPATVHYFELFLETFSAELINAIRKTTLSGFIVVNKKASTSNFMSYEAGEKMTDEELRAFIKELVSCEDGKAKASLIKVRIHNLEDLQAVFGSFSIFDQEYDDVFQSIDDYELAMLCSELVNNSPEANDFALSLDTYHSSENEIYWKKLLIKFVKACDQNIYKNILILAKELKENK